MLRAAWVTLLAAAGCFPPDLGEGRIACGSDGACPPGYVCSAVNNRCYSKNFPVVVDGGARDQSAAADDLAGAHRDMTGGGAADMTDPNVCSATNGRVCTDGSHSATCQLIGNKWTPVPDRTCPTGSSCSLGHCKPPASMIACTTNNGCGTNVCIEYDVNGVLKGYCTTPFVPLMGNQKCTMPGYDPMMCASGICARDATNPSTLGCLNPCSSMSDCPGNKPCDAMDAPMSIEGAPTSTLKFCEPM